jgi:hypothetical protein
MIAWMSPDKKPARTGRSRRPAAARTRPAPDDPYAIAYFKRHPQDDPAQTVPGRAFLNSVPPKVRVTMAAVLTQVAAAPPHRFAGGGKWEAMHGAMSGFHEVRVDGPGRHHYRLFCLLDTVAVDQAGRPAGPYLVVLDGAAKPFRTKFPDAVYDRVRDLGAEYRARNPRSLG